MYYYTHECWYNETVLPDLKDKKNVIAHVIDVNGNPSDPIIVVGGFLDCEMRKATIYFLAEPEKYKQFRLFLKNMCKTYEAQRFKICSYYVYRIKDYIGYDGDVRDISIYDVVLWFRPNKDKDVNYKKIFRPADLVIAGLGICVEYIKQKDVVEYAKKLYENYIYTLGIRSKYYEGWVTRKCKEAMMKIVRRCEIEMIMSYYCLWYIERFKEKLIEKLKEKMVISPKCVIKAIENA